MQRHCVTLLAATVLTCALGASSARAQRLYLDDQPGHLFFGQVAPWFPSESLLCNDIALFVPHEITVHGVGTEDPFRSIAFDVQMTSNVLVLGRRIALAGVVDESEAGDDHWDLRFDECGDQEGAYYPLVTYTVMILRNDGTEWACVSSPDLPEPVWTLCGGGTQPGGRFPMDSPPLLDGCAPINPTFDCPVGSGSETWGTVKSRY